MIVPCTVCIWLVTMGGLSPLYLSVFFYTVEKWGQVNSSRHLYICAYTYASSCIYYTLNIYRYTGNYSVFKLYFLVCSLHIVYDVKLSFTTSALFSVDFSVWYIETGQLLVRCYYGFLHFMPLQLTGIHCVGKLLNLCNVEGRGSTLSESTTGKIDGQ